MNMYKKCSACKLDKITTDFYGNKHKSDGLQTRCKQCSADHSKSRYIKEKPKLRLQIKLASQKRIAFNGQFVWDYLKKHPCVDCGEGNPVVLEFDHVRDIKVRAISKLIWEKSIDAIVSEIEKCEIRCANCHRIRTAESRNWYNNIAK